MKGRQRHHVNPLSLAFQDLRDRRPPLAAGRPVEVEVGCADAQFLFQRAACDPDRQYVGVDIRQDFVRDVNERAARERAPVRAVFCNANRHLDELFEPGSVARIYINFPDPWFKRRHHKRRMVDAELAEACVRALGHGGELFVQTDVWAVALDALAAFDDRLVNRAGPWSFWRGGNPFGAVSVREQRCTDDGLPIWRLLYARAASGAHADGGQP